MMLKTALRTVAFALLGLAGLSLPVSSAATPPGFNAATTNAAEEKKWHD